MIELHQLKKLLHYEPSTGIFTWIVSRSGVLPHRIAGCLHSNGYVHILVKGRKYSAHRLAWFYMTGQWPSNQIDHKNCIRNDNRWNNIREATNNINQQNKKCAMVNSSTGILGAFKNGKSFCSKIRVNGKQKYLGNFKTPEEAHVVYIQAKKKFHEGYIPC